MEKKTNKTKIVIGIIVAAVVLALIGFFGFSSNHDAVPSNDSETNASSEQGLVSEGQGQDEAVSADGVYQLEDDTSVTGTEPVEESTPAPAASSDQNVENQVTLKDNSVINYYGNVQNDATGNWRYSGYSSGAAQEEIALDYYKSFFKSDNEIHALINYAAGNTARITVLDSNTLDVTILEHIENEEQNADTLFSGRILKKYWVYKDTGEVVEVTPD